MEADFLRCYGLDLRVEAERLGLRRLWALVSGLPRDASVWREDNLWTQDMELTATLIEHMDHWFLNLASVWEGVDTSSLPEPLVISHPKRPKPEDVPETASERVERNAAGKRITRDPKEIAAFFGRTDLGGPGTPTSNTTGG